MTCQMLVFIFMLTTVIYCCAATLNKAFRRTAIYLYYCPDSALSAEVAFKMLKKFMVFTKSKLKPQTLPCIVTMQIEYKKKQLTSTWVT